MNDNSYYNTTRLRGIQLALYESKAKGQEKRMAEFFEHNPQLEANRDEIRALLMPAAPISSVTRAIANLTEAGVLEKVEGKQVEGEYGRPIGFWRLKRRHIDREPEQQALRL